MKQAKTRREIILLTKCSNDFIGSWRTIPSDPYGSLPIWDTLWFYDSTTYVPKTPQWVLSDSQALHKSNLETIFTVTNTKRKYASEQGKGEEGSKGVRGKHIFS